MMKYDTMEETIWNKQLNIKKYKVMDDCIAERILKDFLIKRKSEVLEMVLYSFDKELYEKNLKQIAYEEGEKSGMQIGIQTGEQNKLVSQVQKKLAKGNSAEQIAEALEESLETIQDIIIKLQA